MSTNKNRKTKTNKKKKRRIRWDRIFLLLFAILAILALLIFSLSFVFKMLFGKKTNEDVNSTPNTTEIISQKQKKSNLSKEMQERVEAYLDENPNLSEEEAIRCVKMNMDLEPYSETTIIDDDSNPALLLNKFNALPEGYKPDDLVDIKYACTQGVDYSCTTMEEVQLRKVAAKAYEEWVEAAEEEGIDIVAIAAYRTYEYQRDLYNYYEQAEGKAYADAYYARPGQSEHNSGLAVDITFNGYNFNEIENYEGYDWILNNAHKFGWILRYPEEKVDITRYGYESWHFRYVGVDVATLCYENNWCLEEYYGEQ
ncbi:MAG: M15 family metallopeptidase [Bacillota bacterium]|nr:M15 family metallopeptidase [Bacillota bacterium]